MTKTNMGDRQAFFYGTLMAREVLYRVIYRHSSDRAAAGKHLIIRDAILSNHVRRRVGMADYPGVIPQEGSTVRGTYVTGLTDTNIRALDDFEGTEYTRRKVTVKLLSGGEEVEAETYIYTMGDKYLVDAEWSYEEFRKDKLHRWTDEQTEFPDDGHIQENFSAHDPTGGRGTTRVFIDRFIPNEDPRSTKDVIDLSMEPDEDSQELL